MENNPEKNTKSTLRERLLRRFEEENDRHAKEDVIEDLERNGLYQDAADARGSIEDEDAHYGPDDTYDPAEYYG